VRPWAAIASDSWGDSSTLLRSDADESTGPRIAPWPMPS
jgi:hypothetical protein